MTVVPLYVYSASPVAWLVDESLASLKAMVRGTCGRDFRRTSRLAQLALIGAHRCVDVNHSPLGKDCAVFLATTQGNMADSAAVMRQIIAEHVVPTPFSFVNVLSNTAGFYVAQSLGVGGSNIAVARTAFALEATLEMCALHLSISASRTALVGAVDECVFPLEEHRRRLELAPDTPLTEVSSWFHVGASSAGARACVAWVRIWESESAMRSDCRGALSQSDTVLAVGPGLSADHHLRLADALALEPAPLTRHQAYCGDTYTAYLLASFVATPPSRSMLLLNRDSSDRISGLYVVSLL